MASKGEALYGRAIACALVSIVAVDGSSHATLIDPPPNGSSPGRRSFYVLQLPWKDDAI